MYYYLYKITNLINGKIYIGVHRTYHLNDGYMGSGKNIQNAIKKYGIENFEKEILKWFESEEEMYDEEAEIVNEDFIKRNDTYNIIEGGSTVDSGTYSKIGKKGMDSLEVTMKRK